MATGDIIALAALTSLFVAFAATMVWAEVTLCQHAPARTAANAETKRKRRPF